MPGPTEEDVLVHWREFHKIVVDVPNDAFPFDHFFCGNNGAFFCQTQLLHRERPDHDARRGDEGYHGSVPDRAT